MTVWNSMMASVSVNHDKVTSRSRLLMPAVLGPFYNKTRSIRLLEPILLFWLQYFISVLAIKTAIWDGSQRAIPSLRSVVGPFFVANPADLRDLRQNPSKFPNDDRCESDWRSSAERLSMPLIPNSRAERPINGCCHGEEIARRAAIVSQSSRRNYLQITTYCRSGFNSF